MALVPRARNKPNTEWSSGAPRDGSAWSSGAPRDGSAALPDDVALVHDFNALYARYGEKIFNSIYQRVGSREEAEDLTQETFISAHKACDQFRGDAKVTTWLFRIAENHCKNRFKQRDRQREMEGPSLDAGTVGDAASSEETVQTREIADWSGSPAPLLEQKELQAQINRAVDSLQPAYKSVLVLRDVDGLSYNEIVEVTGLTLEAVKTRINRARAMVRQKVEPYLKT